MGRGWRSDSCLVRECDSDLNRSLGIIFHSCPFEFRNIGMARIWSHFFIPTHDWCHPTCEPIGFEIVACRFTCDFCWQASLVVILWTLGFQIISFHLSVWKTGWVIVAHPIVLLNMMSIKLNYRPQVSNDSPSCQSKRALCLSQVSYSQ